MRAAFATLVAAAFLASIPAAAAAPPAEDPTKSAARKIAQEGLDLYDGGKYQDALERFQRADALVHAPTMQLMAARSLAKLGRLVEASERYDAVSKAPLDASASPAFREAVANAGKEREALLPRIPSVVLTVDVAPGVEAAVSIDGVAVPATSLGQKRLVDPGAHTVEARAGGVVKTSRVALKEGETLPVRLDLRPAQTPSSPARTVGFIATGVGAAGLVLGAVTGGLAITKKGDLDRAGCRDNMCPAATADDVNGYNSLRTLSGAGFIAGAIVAAGGVTLIIVAPKPAATTGARWYPVIGIGSVGLQGAF